MLWPFRPHDRIAKSVRCRMAGTHCDQNKKLGWKSIPNRDNLYIFQRFKIHPDDSVVAFKSMPKEPKHVFYGIYTKITETMKSHSFLSEC